MGGEPYRWAVSVGRFRGAQVNVAAESIEAADLKTASIGADNRRNLNYVFLLMRNLGLMTLLVLLLGACGGTTAQPSAPPRPATTTAQLEATDIETTAVPTAPAPTTTPQAVESAGPPATAIETTAVPTAPAPTTTSEAVEPAGSPAPDFALELSDGSAFVLSAHQKPVYLVFWAEW